MIFSYFVVVKKYYSILKDSSDLITSTVWLTRTFTVLMQTCPQTMGIVRHGAPTTAIVELSQYGRVDVGSRMEIVRVINM